MLELKHGDFVYMDTWVGLYANSTAKFGTVEGYARERSLDVADEYEYTVSNGHPTAWAFQPGVCLMGDREAAARAEQRRVERRAQATCLTEGQQVTAEGRTYTVRVPRQNVRGPYNSDPIAFVPVKE